MVEHGQARYEGRMNPPRQSYVLCSNPRSGTTLLCDMLARTGVAGQPDSFFRVKNLPDWCADWQITRQIDPFDPHFTETYFAAMCRAGQGDGDVFGLRLMGSDLQFATRWLGRRHPGLPDDPARFAAAFGPVTFIHLSRTDKLAEAVSYLRAEQSGLWHGRPDGTVLEQLPPQGPPGYDAAALDRRMSELRDLDRAWDMWFAANRIDPLRLTYEALSDGPRETLAMVLAHIGRDPALANGITRGTRKLADATSAAWITRYRAQFGTS